MPTAEQTRTVTSPSTGSSELLVKNDDGSFPFISRKTIERMEQGSGIERTGREEHREPIIRL